MSSQTRDRSEFLLRFLDFFLATLFVDCWAYTQRYLTTSPTVLYDKHRNPVVRHFYDNATMAFEVMVAALSVGLAMFVLGLSSRLLLGQANLFRPLASEGEGWLTADEEGRLVPVPQHSYNLAKSTFVLAGLVLCVAFYSHTATLILLALWALAATSTLPFTVEEIQTPSHRVRKRSTFFGLQWVEEEPAQPLVALTLVLEAVQIETGGYYCVKPVAANGEPIDIFHMSCSSMDPGRSLDKAKNWAKALGLPLKIPPAGFLRIGENALTEAALPVVAPQVQADTDGDWTNVD